MQESQIESIKLSCKPSHKRKDQRTEFLKMNAETVKVLHLPTGKLGPSSRWFHIFTDRARSCFLLILTDAISFSLSAFLAILVRVLFYDGWRFDLYPQVIPVMLVSMVFFGLVGLYPAFGVSAVTELKKLITSTSVVVMAFAAVSFWIRNAEAYSRLTLSLTWIFSLLFLPVGRELTRYAGANLNLWGESVAIVGSGKQSEWALEFFQRNRVLGLIPTAIVGFDEKDRVSWEHKGVQTLDPEDFRLGKDLAKLSGAETALIVISDVPNDFVNFLADHQQVGFKRLILIPNLEQISSYGVNALDFGGVLGLEVRHNLLDASQQALKRSIDIFLVLIGGLLISPFLGLLWLILKLELRDGIFFSHPRIGMGGHSFSAWKFRTMIADADIRLKEYLEQNPAAREEWDTTHKLKNDPRVTKLGRFLRTYSIDELPQLWNVLKGEMSLVGPRPIVTDEVRHYGDRFDPYTWVKPGITGLWQISGRSNTSYEERVSLDEYYVRNWSIWLDIYIFIRTLTIIVLHRGAY
jgi:Undecaprenyl-phosphate galactose phosphotransferase WbaP